MGSPSQRNRTPTKLQESPSLVHLFSDLSPLKSVRTQHFRSFPLSPPPLFFSPKSQGFSKSMLMDSDSQNHIRSHSNQQTEIVQDEQIIGRPEYLAPDPPDIEVDTKSSHLSMHYIKSKQFVPEDADQRHSNVSRHLQFGTPMGDYMIGKELHNSSNSSLPEALTRLQNEQSRITSSLHAGNPAEFSAAFLPTSLYAESFEPTRNFTHGRSTSTCIPSHVGLPFSGITGSLSMESNFIPFKLIGNQNLQEQTQVKDLDGFSNSSDYYAQLHCYQQDGLASSSTLESANYPIISMQPQSDLIYLTPYNNPREVQMLASSNTDNVEELNKPSPKNRKRSKDLSDGEGCKNCNCKRSKCLKLYCECFAAGVYCLDTCACENCFNRPEYEDTVLDTRQQIEIRNPLAFAPKVVKPTTSTPLHITEGSNLTTPSSARHKRGCNCKKSKCLKKYCECYQGGVGCYNGCRCEDCNNCFGRKSESIYRRMESPSRKKMDIFGSNLRSSTAFNHQFPWDSNACQLVGRKVLSDINSDRIYMLEENPIPEILRNSSTPMQTTSPNKKVMSLKILSEDLSSMSSFGSRGIRKLELSSYPPTPCKELKAGEPRFSDNVKENQKMPTTSYQPRNLGDGDKL